MITVKNLLQKLDEETGTRFRSPLGEECTISHAELLDCSRPAPKPFPCPDTLYILADTDSAGAAMPPDTAITDALREAPYPVPVLAGPQVAVSFPVIRANRPFRAQELLFRVQNLLSFEDRITAQINALYRLLTTGQGLERIALLAEEFLHRPVAILDASYSMLAVSPLMRELPFGLETNENGIFLRIEEVESLRRLQIENQIYRRSQAFCVPTADHPETNWIFCAIRIQHVMSGYVAVCLPESAPATEHELRLTTAVADICSVEMQKHDFLIQRTGLQYETFFYDLIEGRFHDVEMIKARLAMLKHHLGSFFCIAVLFSPEPLGSGLFQSRQMGTLRKICPNSLSVVYRNNIVVLLNQDEPVMLTPDLTGPIEQFAEHNNLRVSFSQPFADILKIRIFYEQALHTVDLADKLKTEDTLLFSTQALPEYLFSKCDYQELECGIHHHIFQLQDYDRTFHTEFVPTLRAYLAANRNATAAAEALHIHRSTFFYRMKKIEEILGISTSDSSLLFLYELSFRIWDFLTV